MSREMVDFVLANRSKMTLKELSSATKMARSTIYTILRREKKGCSFPYQNLERFDAKEEERKEYIASHWGVMLPCDIAKALGMSKSRVWDYFASKEVKSKVTDSQLRQMELLYKKQKSKNSKIAAAKRNRKRKMEILRILSGEPRNPKINVCILGKAPRGARQRLKWKYNYFFFEDEPYNLYYDEQTNRRLEGRCKESYYTKKYGFSFIKADD